MTECTTEPGVDRGPLSGLRVGVKDAIAVADVPMEAASGVLSGFVPRTDATVVRRLLSARASITAKTNLDEFAGSAHGTTAASGPITNPWDETCTAGGSPGGSAVAVARDRVDVALSTDTGGSIRIPAAFCGVVGVKPTYGLVPLTGIVENTYTQDHVGPMANSIRDAARTLEAIAGPDEGDPASLTPTGGESYQIGGYVDAVERGREPSDLTIGLLREGAITGVDDGVVERTSATLDRLADAGASLQSVSVDGYEHFKAVKNVVSVSEIAAHWRAYAAPYRRGGRVEPAYQAAFADSRRDASRTMNHFYKGKILAGAYLMRESSGTLYTNARQFREVLREELEDALAGVDVLVTPTTPSTAPRLEEADDPGFDYALNTRPANVTRLPAVTIPNGTVGGLPTGLQLIGSAFDEAELLAAAAALTEVTPGA
ncbi:amidase [Halegenticoccus soli]|uniref:amidase n=1 Tax=Halegenticoccus soli TaxID=1985678 RepID=UPI0013041EE3|nr:amidase family protein [Halegenticoccus soli]